MKCILGKKVGMSQVFLDQGETKRVVPVTVVAAEPCTAVQVREIEKDGYLAVQVGSGEAKRANQPLAGHLKAAGKFFKILREFRGEKIETEAGAVIDVSVFEEGDKVKVSGVTRGKGFQGAMKRHGFHGGQATHGQKHSKRKVGAIGATYPERVIKGKRMAGRDGGTQATQLGLEIVKVDKENNMLLVKGSVPGHNGGLLKIVAE